MKKLAFLGTCLTLLLTAVPARAQRSGNATVADLQRLQTDLDNLDEVLATLPTDSRATDFRQRADEIRDDVTWLRVQVRRNQRNRSAGLGATVDDVDQLRSEINALRNDIEVAYGYRYTGPGEARLPEGTDFQVRLEQALSSKTARPEQRFDATVVRPVRIDNRIVVSPGALVRGVVRSVQPAQRPARGGRLELAFDRIQLDGRTWVDMQTRVVSMRENLDRSETARNAGIGAALGGILGQVIGGTKGAILGVLVGGAGGAIASEGEEVELPEGTILTLRLEQPVSLFR